MKSNLYKALWWRRNGYKVLIAVLVALILIVALLEDVTLY